MNPTIDPEFRALIPPLNEEELRHLHNSLSAEGVRDALVVWKEENILVDGHNRWEYSKGRDLLPPPRFEYLSFDDREEVKQFMIMNQLGRRNVTPETASKLRAELGQSINKGRGGNRNPEGVNQHAGRSKSDNQTLTNNKKSPATDTLTEVAKRTGVSRATVAADVRLMKALDKLGISRNDYAAGKVLDADGKKRSKKSILDEAFPPKKKPAPAPALAAAAAPAPAPAPSPAPTTVENDDDDDDDDLYEYPPREPVIPPRKPELTTDEAWKQVLEGLPKLTKELRQELCEILAKKWDCKHAPS